MLCCWELVFGRGGPRGCLPDYIRAAQCGGGLGEDVFERDFLICGPVEDLGIGVLGKVGSG